MCIFTGDIDMVSSTNIFARMHNGKQLIVYDMYLQTQIETAMVLPIPELPGTPSIDFVDLSDYSQIFNACRKITWPDQRVIRNI